MAKNCSNLVERAIFSNADKFNQVQMRKYYRYGHHLSEERDNSKLYRWVKMQSNAECNSTPSESIQAHRLYLNFIQCHIFGMLLQFIQCDISERKKQWPRQVNFPCRSRLKTQIFCIWMTTFYFRTFDSYFIIIIIMKFI